MRAEAFAEGRIDARSHLRLLAVGTRVGTGLQMETCSARAHPSAASDYALEQAAERDSSDAAAGLRLNSSMRRNNIVPKKKGD